MQHPPLQLNVTSAALALLRQLNELLHLPVREVGAQADQLVSLHIYWEWAHKHIKIIKKNYCE